MTNNYGPWDEHAEQRETLNAIRRVGKGSRGGKGARKRRNGGKISTRRRSKREEQAAEDALCVVIESCALNLSEAQRSDTEEMLRRDFGFAAPVSPGAFLDAVSESSRRSRVIKANRQYHKALVYVYAQYELIVSADQPVRCDFIRLVSERSKIPLGPSFDLVRALLRLAIDYEEDNPESDNRRKYSRDALAIKWLIQKGIRSTDVIAYQKEYGGGVDTWSRPARKGSSLEKRKVLVNIRATQLEHRLSDLQPEIVKRDNYARASKWGNWNHLDYERNRVRKAAGGGIWTNEMLLYFNRQLLIAPGEVMFCMVIGDSSTSIGVRHIGTASLGRIGVGADNEKRLFESSVGAVQALAHPGEPWSEEAWLGNLDGETRKAREGRGDDDGIAESHDRDCEATEALEDDGHDTIAGFDDTEDDDDTIGWGDDMEDDDEEEIGEGNAIDPLDELPDGARLSQFLRLVNAEPDEAFVLVGRGEKGHDHDLRLLRWARLGRLPWDTRLEDMDMSLWLFERLVKRKIGGRHGGTATEQYGPPDGLPAAARLSQLIGFIDVKPDEAMVLVGVGRSGCKDDLRLLKWAQLGKVTEGPLLKKDLDFGVQLFERLIKDE